MEPSDRGALALRISALLILAAIMLGLLVWYGSVSTAAAAVLVARAAGSVDSLAAAGSGTVARPAIAAAGVQPVHVSAPALLLVDAAALPLSHHRAPWEAYYMYGVSALAGCWVFARLASQWRLDPRTLSLRPRAAEDVVPSRPLPVCVEDAPSRSNRDRSAHATGALAGGAAPASPASAVDRPAALLAGGPTDGSRRLPPSPAERRGTASPAGTRAVRGGGDGDA